MKEDNAFLTEEQARHLTIHGASRNEDGTWSWKFDNYLNVWPVTDTPTDQMIELWRAITCPMLLLWGKDRSEEHTSELQSLMRSSYAVLCLKKKNKEYT